MSRKIDGAVPEVFLETDDRRGGGRIDGAGAVFGVGALAGDTLAFCETIRYGQIGSMQRRQQLGAIMRSWSGGLEDALKKKQYLKKGSMIISINLAVSFQFKSCIVMFSRSVISDLPLLCSSFIPGYKA